MLYNYYYTIVREDEIDIQLLSDAILRTEDGFKFNVHKYELSRRSPFFYELYRENSSEGGDILIPRIRGEILDVILYYIYTDNLCIYDNQLIDLVIASKYFQLVDMSVKLVEYARENMTVRNSLQIHQAAFHIPNKEILHNSYRFSLMHFEEIVHSANRYIVQLDVDTLKKLLRNESLGVRNESVVWECIVRWIEFDKECRQIHVPEFLLCLKVGDLNEDIAHTIIEHDIVANNRFCTAINELKTSNLLSSYLNIITVFYQSHHVSILDDIGLYRLPSCLYLFKTQTDEVDWTFYITYDDNLDLWRNIYTQSTNDIIPIGQVLYFPKPGFDGRLYLFCFDFIENSEMFVRRPEGRTSGHILLSHMGLMYSLSETRIPKAQSSLGVAFGTDFRKIYERVKVYNPTIDEWRDCPSMVSVSRIAAVSLGRKMYVFGAKLDNYGTAKILVQAYDPQSNEWELLPSPLEYRYSYALISYCNKLFMIGGRKPRKRCRDVEAFDPALNRWMTFSVLPHTFDCIRAIVVKNHLIVYNKVNINNDLSKCPVMWNNEHQRWMPVGLSSPVYELLDYDINCIDDRETIKILMLQNRGNAGAFEKTPFN